MEQINSLSTPCLTQISPSSSFQTSLSYRSMVECVPKKDSRFSKKNKVTTFSTIRDQSPLPLKLAFSMWLFLCCILLSLPFYRLHPKKEVSI